MSNPDPALHATRPDIPLVWFQPWVGSRYQDGNRFGKRVLVLGEAHYEADLSLDGPGYTEYVVRRHGQELRTVRFFTMVPKILLQLGARQRLSDEDRSDAWEHVAFYNYVQELVGNAARKRPTREMWESAKRPLLNVIEALDPQIILVLGIALGHHLPQLPATITVCKVQHPSSSFSFSQWNPRFAEALTAARA